MTTITTRAGKGTPLTNAEVDANFTNLNTDKLESTDITLNTAAASGSGGLAYTSGTTTFTYTPPNLAGYLTGNQTITLSGDASGTGTTSIAVTVEDDSHAHTLSTISDISNLAGVGLSWSGSALDVDAVNLKRIKLGKSGIFENINPTPSTIAWDVETHKDTGYTHSTVTNPERVTVSEAGSYRVIANVNFINADANRVTGQLELRKNGAILPNTVAKGYSRGSTYGTDNVQIVTIVDLAANDYLDVWASVDDADAASAFTTLATSEFIIERATTEAVGNTWRAIHDTPVDAAAAISISSNWAFDHLATHAPIDADNTAANETSHADVLVDTDFASNGFMVRTGLGTYTIDNSVYALDSHTHSAFDYSTTLTGATVFEQITVVDGIVTGITTRDITLGNLGYTGATDANNYSHPATHPWSILTSTPTTLGGYGITDGYTSTQIDALTWNANDITAGTFLDARISESSVTQHQAALSLTESQITDLGPYNNYSHPATHPWSILTSTPTTLGGYGIIDAYTSTEVDALTWDTSDITTGVFLDARISQSNVTQHQAALSLTESQISDLTHYTHPGTHPWSMITSTPTTLGGYGITDALQGVDLSVSTIAASSGGSLTYSSGTGVFTFTPADLSSVTTTLAGLTDTVITTPQADESLVYNGTNWVNAATVGGGTQVYIQTLEPSSWNVGDAWIKIPA